MILLHFGEPLPCVVRQAQTLQLALGVEAQQDSVEDVHVDQGTGRATVLWGMMMLLGTKISNLKFKEDKMISPFQTRLATYLTASR